MLRHGSVMFVLMLILNAVDALTLSLCVDQVGQVHGGLIGVIQRAMLKACPHIWFERSEVKDRHLVAKR